MAAGDAAEKLLNALRDNKSRVIDIFLKLDKDMSGSIDKKEFRQVMLFAKDLTFERPAIDSAFDLLDADGSGEIDLKELDRLLRVGYAEILNRKLQAGAMGEIVLKAENTIEIRKRDKDESAPGTYGGSGGGGAAAGSATALQRTFRGGDLVKEGTQTIANSHVMEVNLGLADGEELTAEAAEAALRQALNENAVRVIDLFRDWDVNGDGAVSMREFVTGVTLLGLPGGKAAAALFRVWDADGSGSLSIAELNRILRRGNDISGLPPKVDYCVNISSRRNWSRRKVDGASGVVLHMPKGNVPHALSSRPAASPAHDAWRRSAQANGRTSPLISPAVPPKPSGRSGRHSPPRSADEVLEHLTTAPTATVRARERQSFVGRRGVVAPPQAVRDLDPSLPIGAATYNALYMKCSASAGSLLPPASDPFSPSASAIGAAATCRSGCRSSASHAGLETSSSGLMDMDSGPSRPAYLPPRVAPTNSTNPTGTTTGMLSPRIPSPVKGVMASSSAPTSKGHSKGSSRGAKGGRGGGGGGGFGDTARMNGYFHAIPSEAAGFFGASATLTPRGSAYLDPPAPIVDGSSLRSRGQTKHSGGRARTPLYDALPPSGYADALTIRFTQPIINPSNLQGPAPSAWEGGAVSPAGLGSAQSQPHGSQKVKAGRRRGGKAAYRGAAVSDGTEFLMPAADVALDGYDEDD